MSTKRRAADRYPIVIVIGLLLALHFYLRPRLWDGRGAPDFLMLALMLVAIRSRPGVGAVVGFLVGLTTDILTLKADYNVTANLSWANLAQYDNESMVAGLQSRFRWILQPGNDLFLIINRGWLRTLDESRFQPLFDRASVKLQYTVRF